MQRDNEDEIEELMNDFDMELTASKEIELTDNSDNVNALTLASNLHVVDQGTTHTKEELETKKREKSRRKYPDHMEMQNFSTFSKELSCCCQPI